MIRDEETQPLRQLEADTHQVATDAAPAPLLVVEEAGGRRLHRVAGVAEAGTGEGADLHLQGEGVGARHVKFEAGAGGTVARALGVLRRNGRQWAGGPLENGDRLQVGRERLRFVAPGGVVLLRGEGSWWRWGLAALLCACIGYVAAAACVRISARSGGTAAAPPPAAVEPRRDEAAAPPDAREAIRLAPDADGAPQAPVAAIPSVAMVPAPAEAIPGVAAEAPAPPAPAAAPPAPNATPPAPALSSPPTRAAGGERSRLGPRRPGSERRPQAAVPAGAAAAPAEPAHGSDGAPLAALHAAWDAGALDEVERLARAARPAHGEGEERRLEILQFAGRVQQFSRALSRARSTEGVAAAPALEQALGWAEEIGREAPQVQEVRRSLSYLHRTAARRAEEAGDLHGALHHCEQALAVLPRDPAARGMREALAGRARGLFLEGYSLQHLDPERALRQFDLAAALGLEGDPWGAKARAWAGRLRGIGTGAEAAGAPAPGAL